MKILILQQINSLWKGYIEDIKREFPQADITDDASSIGEAEVIIGTRLSEDLIHQAESLKVVLVPMAGVDKLPLEHLFSRNIRIANVHGNAESVAERAVALVLAWYGNIIPYHHDLQENRWHAFWLGNGIEDTWESVAGKKCSILGAGAIGYETAKRIKPFSVSVIGYKKTPAAPIPEVYDEMVYDIDEALEKGEIIISVLPETPETAGLINRKRLEAMEGKVLVNVGRGSVIEEEPLYHALRTGTLRGAALDCWYEYPRDQRNTAPSQFPFRDLPNVIMSPHVAGFTRDSVQKSVQQVFENLRCWLREGTLLYEIDPEKRY